MTPEHPIDLPAMVSSLTVSPSARSTLHPPHGTRAPPAIAVILTSQASFIPLTLHGAWHRASRQPRKELSTSPWGSLEPSFLSCSPVSITCPFFRAPAGSAMSCFLSVSPARLWTTQGQGLCLSSVTLQDFQLMDFCSHKALSQCWLTDKRKRKKEGIFSSCSLSV